VVPLYTTDLPEVHDVITGFRRVIDEFPERLLIGEIYLPIEKLVAYYGRDLEGTHLPFNFTLLDAQWRARPLEKLIDDYEAALPKGGWPNWVLGNHDRPRIASRVGREQARVAAMLLLTLRGTPTVYYGDELGLPHVPIPPDRVQDPFEKNVPGIGVGRDGARTPMQWDTSPHAGFSTIEPWLPLTNDWHSENIENQTRDATSFYNLYRRLIACRRKSCALTEGAYRPVVARGELLLYVRECPEERVLVALNLGDEAISVAFPGGLRGRVLVSCLGDRDGEEVSGSIDLRDNDGLVVELAPDAVVPGAVEH
jgi:alpha-glucosidase